MDLREQDSQQPGASRHPWERARLRVVHRLLQKTGAATTVLDVGCGDAYVIQTLADKGFGDSFLGVDDAINEDYTLTHQSAHIQVVNTLDARAIGTQGQISHVLLLDVLEHVADDVALLGRVRRLPQVGSGCIFLITVPAHPQLFSEHDRILGHHRRYTGKMLKQTVKDAGLLCRESGAFFSSLLAPRAFEKFRERLGGRDKKEVTDLSAWYGSDSKTRLLENILYSDFLLAEAGQAVGIKLPGLSEYALCAVP